MHKVGLPTAQELHCLLALQALLQQKRVEEWYISHSIYMATANLNKSEEFVTNTTAASKYIPRRPKIFWIAPKIFFALQYIKKQIKVVPWNFFFVPEKKNFSLEKTTFEILWSEVWKGGFQLMLILGLLGMYFDAAVVFVTNS